MTQMHIGVRADMLAVDNMAEAPASARPAVGDGRCGTTNARPAAALAARGRIGERALLANLLSRIIWYE